MKNKKDDGKKLQKEKRQMKSHDKDDEKNNRQIARKKKDGKTNLKYLKNDQLYELCYTNRK